MQVSLILMESDIFLVTHLNIHEDQIKWIVHRFLYDVICLLAIFGYDNIIYVLEL